jgi:hypothetical protein
MKMKMKPKSLKPKTCRVCKVKYTPRTSLQSVCGYDCSLTYTNLLAEKKKRADALKSRKETREKLAKLKTRQQQLKEAQQVFNTWIRMRDENLPCISCGRHHKGQYHAGHYRTTGSSPHLRFNEHNTNKQCAPCNNHLSGNIVHYRLGLIQKIGIQAVDALENNQEPTHYAIPDIVAIKNLYKAKIKELKANGN